ncbi:DoxX family protein [Microcoleus sp.]|uniref:DoxX family protein n=1 Tax=Microcoleus sp. TaxID=44472 RepID=UPI0035242E4B
MKTQKEIWRVILAVAISVVGVLHFAVPAPFIKIMPPQLPYPEALVYISGFFEILGGIGLLVPPVSRAAAWGLIALFIAVFPANINQAINSIPIEGIPHHPLLYWFRLPFQAVLIAWAWVYTKPDQRTDGNSVVSERVQNPQ